MSTALTLISTDQDLLNFDDASFDYVVNEAFLATTSPLMLLGAFSPSLADTVESFANNITDLSGQIIINGGVFDTNLTLPDGSTVSRVFDVPTTLTTYADLAGITNGTATLTGGILQAEITTGEASASLENVNLAEIVSTQVLAFVNGLNGVIPFENGAFTFATDSALGPISGSADIGGGDLNLDILTPFGAVSADVDFGEGAVFPFVIPSPLGDIDAAIDLNAGNVVASLGFFGDIAIPISDIDGSLTLADGIATFSADVFGLGTVESELAIGPLASEAVAELIQDLDGTATITEGVLEASLTSDALGDFVTTFDIEAFTRQGASFFDEVSGAISIGEGTLTADITSPLGDLENSYNLVEFAGLIDVPFGELLA
jgi:hypothetical protein